MGKHIYTPLTCELLREHFSYDARTGSFSRLKWAITSSSMRIETFGELRKKDGYLQMRVLGKYYLAHRLAWLHFYGAWPVHTIDHINRNRSDNRIGNLRDVPFAENIKNTRRLFVGAKPPVNSAIVKRVGHGRGVFKSTYANTWTSSIQINGKRKYLGSFRTPDEARAAYLKAAAIINSDTSHSTVES